MLANLRNWITNPMPIRQSSIGAWQWVVDALVCFSAMYCGFEFASFAESIFGADDAAIYLGALAIGCFPTLMYIAYSARHSVLDRRSLFICGVFLFLFGASGDYPSTMNALVVLIVAMAVLTCELIAGKALLSSLPTSKPERG
jgi:Na+/melibiose symporter-like transporter